MKKIICSLLVLSTILVFVSCKKDQLAKSAEPEKLAISATKTQAIKIGESVTFSTNLSYMTIEWSAPGEANVSVGSDTRYASIVFSKAGTYTISAKSALETASQTVTVSNETIFPDPNKDVTPTYTLASLAGDEIKLSLSREDLNSITALSFDAETKNNYDCLNNFLVNSVINNSGNYDISFSNVSIPSSTLCTGGKTTAKSSFGINIRDAVVHSISVKLNGVTYTGSFVRGADGTVTVTWPYTSGVTISPLVLPK